MELMDTRELVQQLVFEYDARCILNPKWGKSLWSFLVERGVKPDDIWEYSPSIGWNAGQDEPNWL